MTLFSSNFTQRSGTGKKTWATQTDRQHSGWGMRPRGLAWRLLLSSEVTSTREASRKTGMQETPATTRSSINELWRIDSVHLGSDKRIADCTLQRVFAMRQPAASSGRAVPTFERGRWGWEGGAVPTHAPGGVHVSHPFGRVRWRRPRRHRRHKLDVLHHPPLGIRAPHFQRWQWTTDKTGDEIVVEMTMIRQTVKIEVVAREKLERLWEMEGVFVFVWLR
ncbi:hypothetical protein BKA93DRAFT_48970 [Sparassis latifolia]